MSLDLIGKHKKELLVLAMLWMSIRHMYLPISNKLIGFVFSNCGYGSIDMILFVLGFASYQILEKDDKYKNFIKDRMSKILPYSILFFIFMFVIQGIVFEEFLTYLLGISIFYRTDLQYWLLSLVILLFLITPLYFKPLIKKPYLVTTILCLLVAIICSTLSEYRLVYIYFRIIIYLLGMVFGYFNSSCSYKRNKIICISSIIMMVFGWIFIFYLYHFYRNDIMHIIPFIFIAPGICVFLSWLIDKIKISQKTLLFFSNYLVMYYLVHENIIKLFYDHYDDLYIYGIGFDWWINIFGFIASIFVSIIATELVNIFIKYVREFCVNKFVK